MIGVDLLANTSKKIEDVTDNVNNGYSSGVKNLIKVIKKILIFSNAEPSEEKNIKVDIKKVHTSAQYFRSNCIRK